MANAQEKEALGLKADATDEEAISAINKLKAQAESAKETAREAKAEAKEANERAEAAEEAAASGGSVSSDPRDEEVGEGQVRTALGVEDTEEVRVKVLSVTWTEYKPSPLIAGQYIAVEHRSGRNDVVEMPISEIKRLRGLNALFTDAEFDVEDASDESAKLISEMSQAELINWHRSTEPSAQQVVDAAGGDVDVARNLIAAEELATGGDPRDEVMQGLAEVIARGSA